MRALLELFAKVRRFLRRAFNLPGWETHGLHFPTRRQWRHTASALTLRERVIVLIGSASILIAATISGGQFYLKHTEALPAEGGSVIVGIVGRPLYINPVLSPSNPTDEDVVRLVYSGLFKLDNENRLVPDLAESYAIGDFGKVVEVRLKEGLRWPDEEPFSAEDVVFTVNTIKNPAIRSPLFNSWSGIVAEAVGPSTVRFTLPSPYPPFLANLTLGILPQHAWQDVAPENFALSEQNLKPMGLGPFRPIRFERTREGRIVSYTLKPNDVYPRRPFLSQVVFRFYDRTDDALLAFNRREITLLNDLEPEMLNDLRSGAKTTSTALPRIFGVFFNQVNSKVAADKTVRMALAYSTNRTPLLESLGGDLFAQPLERPIPAEMLGATEETARYDLAPEHAQNILEAAGWTKGDNGIRTKGGSPLALTLTFRDGPDMQSIGESLRDQWRTIGADIELRPLAPAAFRKAIMDRDYQLVLAGEELPNDPDPYAFWHSSQKFDPGGNIALYDSKEADTVLEASRTEFDEKARAVKYMEFQKILMNDLPAIFLWEEKLASATGPTLHGFGTDFLMNPSWQFGNAASWYVQSKRVWNK